MTRKSFTLCFLSVFLCFSSQAIAIPTIPWDTTDTNFVTDDSAEYKLDYTGTFDDEGNPLEIADKAKYSRDITDSIIQIGDRFIGAFEIDNLTYGTTVNTLKAQGIEFTGAFDIMVTSKVAVDSNDDGVQDKITIPGTTDDKALVWDFFFGPTPLYSFDSGVSGAMLTSFIDDWGNNGDELSDDDFNRLSTGTVDDVIDLATNAVDVADPGFGATYWTFGYTNPTNPTAAGEGWSTRGTDDLSLFKLFGQGTEFGEVNFALNLLQNYLGPDLAKQVSILFGPGLGETVDFIGSAGLKGIKGSTTPMDVFDNLDGQLRPIPEPTTIMLLGFGLLSLSGLARRKKK